MSAFYVGQRVRIVGDASRWDPECREANGREGRINHLLDADGLYGVTDSAGVDWDCAPYILEPIVDDGRQVISWADMAGLWTPEEVAA